MAVVEVRIGSVVQDMIFFVRYLSMFVGATVPSSELLLRVTKVEIDHLEDGLD